MALEQIEANRLKKLEKDYDFQKNKIEISQLQKQSALKEVTKEENYKNVLKFLKKLLNFYFFIVVL